MRVESVSTLFVGENITELLSWAK